jgi:hypothetical protein
MFSVVFWALITLSCVNRLAAQNLEYSFTMGVTSPAPTPGEAFTITWTGGEATELVYIVLNYYFADAPSEDIVYIKTDILCKLCGTINTRSPFHLSADLTDLTQPTHQTMDLGFTICLLILFQDVTLLVLAIIPFSSPLHPASSLSSPLIYHHQIRPLDHPQPPTQQPRHTIFVAYHLFLTILIQDTNLHAQNLSQEFWRLCIQLSLLLIVHCFSRIDLHLVMRQFPQQLPRQFPQHLPRQLQLLPVQPSQQVSMPRLSNALFQSRPPQRQ